MKTPYKKYKALINQRAKYLRNNPTKAEAELWKFLRRKQLCNKKFLRQHPILFGINNRVYFFIADFCCHELKLIIEVDGDIHDKKEQREYDLMRSGTLNEMGFTVLRFKNKEIFNNIEDVLKKIKTILASSLPFVREGPGVGYVAARETEEELRPSNNEIAILDFGSQYTHLIARRIRELGVKSHIYPNDIPADELKNAVGIILSGGPKSVVSDVKLAYDPKLFELNIPILGLCYGHQLTAQHFDGTVSKGEAREYGLAKMNIIDSPIFQNIDQETTVWMSHGDHVAKLPDGFKQIATTGNDSVAAMENTDKKIFGFQFHPEVTHTKQGQQILTNFVFHICGAAKNWDTSKMLEQIQTEIKQQVGNKNVFLLISGGVDSTVCFALLEKTLGKDRVYGLHVDSGFMRMNESELVKKSLAKIGLDDLHIYNAEAEYLEKLKNIYDPEKKRKIIGELFIDITERVMKEQNFNESDWLLGQGTIYPDTIESGATKNADKIKTHHNRIDRIQDMIARGLIIEPIKDLYKDEVRQIGEKLGLPSELIHRHPFPGPGLAIRCLCSEQSNQKVSVIARSDGGATSQSPRQRDSYGSEEPRNDSYSTIYQLPIKSVGVQGDERSYAHPAVIVENTSQTTKPNALPFTRGGLGRGCVATQKDWKNLAQLSPQITNQYKNINRVLLLVHGDKEKIMQSKVNRAYLTKKRTDLLREIDYIVNININNPDCEHIWQFPVVLIPFGYNHAESVVLRPVESKEAMTVSFAKLPAEILENIVNEINKLGSVDFIFYDLTNKPPGTIEWE